MIMDEEKEGEEKKAKGKVDEDEPMQLSKASTGRCYFDLFRTR